MTTGKGPIVTAYGNRKGGVGKTSTVLGVAAMLAAAGEKILVVDLDAQSDATRTLGVSDVADDQLDIFDVLYAGESGTLDQAIVPTTWQNVWAVPGSKQLSRIESESMMTPEFRLSTAADGVDLDMYDHVLVDLPPNIGRLTLNGLIFAHQVYVLTEAGVSSSFGVQEFMETIEAVQKSRHLNAHLAIGGIILNAVGNPPTDDDRYWMSQLRSIHGPLVVDPVLHRRTAVKDAAARGVPIHEIRTAGGEAMAKAYDRLAKHITTKGDRS
jgi:chromosome partitioning protein